MATANSFRTNKERLKVLAKVDTAIEKGTTQVKACEDAGISVRTFHDWDGCRKHMEKHPDDAQYRGPRNQSTSKKRKTQRSNGEDKSWAEKKFGAAPRKGTKAYKEWISKVNKESWARKSEAEKKKIIAKRKNGKKTKNGNGHAKNGNATKFALNGKSHTDRQKKIRAALREIVTASKKGPESGTGRVLDHLLSGMVNSYVVTDDVVVLRHEDAIKLLGGAPDMEVKVTASDIVDLLMG